MLRQISPVMWVLGALAVALTLAGERLSAQRGPGAPPPGQQERAAAGRPDAPAQSHQVGAGRTVTLDGDRAGHFRAEVAVDGLRLPMLVDTGASIVALTYDDAAKAGIRPFPSDFTRPIGTANGSVGAAPVRLREVRVGDITVRDVEAVVMPRGRLGMSLLGMSFLRQLRGFDVADNRLTLRG